MPAITPDQAAAALQRRMLALRDVGKEPIEAAHAVVAGAVPVYTGAYAKAVKVKFSRAESSVGVTTGGIEAAQPAEIFLRTSTGGEVVEAGPDRAYWNLHGQPPVGEYPLRIEVHGGPKSGRGKGMWAEARSVAQAALLEAFKRIGGIR